MNKTGLKPTLTIEVTITYLGMVLVNALANILPINGITTGDVSDAYPNLFAPAGITFAIWGVIYLLLAGYTLYQLGLFRNQSSSELTTLINYIGIRFTVSSLANILWILAWHYRKIGVSMVLMTVILACLFLINRRTRGEQLTFIQKILVRLPFSVYFGWICVATIANMTTLLVDIDWKGLGISSSTWTILMLLVGIAIGILTTIRNQDIAYGLVFVWAYAGILLKHISPEMFNFRYPGVVYTAMTSIILMLAAGILVLNQQIRYEQGKLRGL